LTIFSFILKLSAPLRCNSNVFDFIRVATQESILLQIKSLKTEIQTIDKNSHQ